MSAVTYLRAGAYNNAWANHRLLLHLYEHDIHHRGQAHAMLAGTNAAPPQLDEFYCSNEAHLRADEFAALGFSEQAIWGDLANN